MSYVFKLPEYYRLTDIDVCRCSGKAAIGCGCVFILVVARSQLHHLIILG